MSTLLHDFRYAMRMLAKSPGFTAVAVLSLALGIGANTAIFSVLNAVLLKALPFNEPESIVLVWGAHQKRGLTRAQLSATDVADIRKRNSVFEEIATYASVRPAISDGRGEPERIPGAQVGDGFFDVMRAKPLLGRVFTPEEQIEGNDFVVVLSYGLWQRRFGGDPDVIGKTVMLSARPYTIIGVMPADFRSLPSGLLDAPAELYRPVAEPPDDKQRSSRHLRAIARLKPGVTLAAAQTEMNLIVRQLEQEYPEDYKGGALNVVSLREDLIGKIRPALLMLFGAVAFLLLIACANVGNLLLARSLARRKEVAIRAALGAGRAQIIRQFLTESVLLAVAGGALGLMMAVWGTTFIEAVAAEIVPMLGAIEIDARVLGFTAAVSLTTGLLFGSAPALRASRADLNATLSDGARGAVAGSTRSVLRSSLVVVEIALAMVLLVGAGLLIRSVMRLHAVDPGFKPERILTMNIWLPNAKYPKGADFIAFYDRALERIRALPEVEAAAMTSVLPISENFDQRTIEAEGQPKGPGENPDVDNYFVTPDYLRTMSIPLRRGRALTEHDREDTPLVVLASETTARQLWPNEDPIGKRIRYYNKEENRPWRTVVGVVGDVKQYGLDTTAKMAIYVPVAQNPNSAMTLVVKTRTAPETVIAPVRREIRAVDPDQAVFSIRSMDQLLADSIALRRFSMFLLGIFAALALLLAAIGIYGVLAQSVVQRTHEIGIRMALGAQMRDVLRLILGHGMTLAVLGIIAGIAGALGTTRLLANLLFGVAPTDASTFLAIAFLLGAVAFLACYLPARRAAKLDPVTALANQ
ncbi:MAG TPA: ABC transporter permease [Chthoniobacterales bacterium]|nr:ABC transporter permease [Chthoniobacterales bacterium]